MLCTEYKGLTESQEIELFQRVQLGTPLTKAEAFRATQGSWQNFAKQYEKEFHDVISCKHLLSVAQMRSLTEEHSVQKQPCFRVSHFIHLFLDDLRMR